MYCLQFTASKQPYASLSNQQKYLVLFLICIAVRTLMSTYKFYYFNSRGRSETCRLIFAAAGQQFEDIRYDHAEWPSHKSEMVLGQLPVLEYNGVQLPQSMAIARFLGKQFQLAGKDHFEQAKVDAVGDTINDMVSTYVPSRRERDETKKQELTNKFIKEDLPKHIQNIDKLRQLYSDGGAFFVGNNLTWVDLMFYDIGESMLGLDGKCLDDYPWLQQNRAEVAKQPRIAEYLNHRPKTAS